MSLLTSIVGYFKFDESSGNAADSVGSNTLVNTNTATYGAAKINNGVICAKASSQYLTKTSPTGIPGSDNTGGDFSINMWVKLTTAPGTNSRYTFACIWNSTFSWRFSYLQDGSDVTKFQFITSSTGSNFNVASVNATLTAGTMYMITLVYTAASHSVEFFINGVSQGTADTVHTALFNNSGATPFDFGARGTAGDEFSGAQFDEAGFWARVLDSGDMTSLYNGGAGFQYPFAAPANSGFLMFMPR